MSKIILDDDVLDDFSDFLKDVIFTIKSEVYKKNIDRDAIIGLLDQMQDTWNKIYDPVVRTLNQSKRHVYSQYIKAKKAGEQEKAQEYLSLYIKLKKGI